MGNKWTECTFLYSFRLPSVDSSRLSLDKVINHAGLYGLRQTWIQVSNLCTSQCAQNKHKVITNIELVRIGGKTQGFKWKNPMLQTHSITTEKTTK